MAEDRPLALTDPELRQVAALLETTFVDATHLDEPYLDWCYRQNPVGRAVGRNAWEGDRLRAHYVTVPLRAGLFGEERRGVLSLHTATHP